MNRFLIVIDLQEEFAKGFKGKNIYKRALNYVYANKDKYHCVFAAVYQQDTMTFINMQRKLNWDECQSVKPVEFPYDRIYYHSGYSINEYPNFQQGDRVDVIGFDTDACVLAACFDLFNIDCDLHILTDYIYSSGGEDMHKHGLAVMKRQFGKCVE